MEPACSAVCPTPHVLLVPISCLLSSQSFKITCSSALHFCRRWWSCRCSTPSASSAWAWSRRAARSPAARPARTFRSGGRPLTTASPAAGSVLVMIPSIGLFYVADLLGGAKTVLIGNLIQNQFRQANDWPFGSAVSVILAALTMILIFLYVRSGGKEEDLL